MLNPKILEDDRGLTLLEVLIGTVITALISITIFRLGSDASMGMDRTVDRAVAQAVTGSYAQIIRGDIAASVAVTVYTATPPAYSSTDATNTSALCSSWMTSHDPTAWSTPAQAGFVRTLFTLRQALVASTSTVYTDATIRWVGYEIRGTAGKDATGAALVDYSLWRVTCGETAGVADLPSASGSRQIIDLGVNFDPSAAGSNTLFCNGLGTVVCATSGTAGIDTNPTVSAFSFKLPYKNVKQLTAGSAGSGSLTQRDATFANSLTTNLQRKVN